MQRGSAIQSVIREWISSKSHDVDTRGRAEPGAYEKSTPVVSEIQSMKSDTLP